MTIDNQRKFARNVDTICRSYSVVCDPELPAHGLFVNGRQVQQRHLLGRLGLENPQQVRRESLHLGAVGEGDGGPGKGKKLFKKLLRMF